MKSIASIVGGWGMIVLALFSIDSALAQSHAINSVPISRNELDHYRTEWRIKLPSGELATSGYLILASLPVRYDPKFTDAIVETFGIPLDPVPISKAMDWSVSRFPSRYEMYSSTGRNMPTYFHAPFGIPLNGAAVRFQWSQWPYYDLARSEGLDEDFGVGMHWLAIVPGYEPQVVYEGVPDDRQSQQEFVYNIRLKPDAKKMQELQNRPYVHSPMILRLDEFISPRKRHTKSGRKTKHWLRLSPIANFGLPRQLKTLSSDPS